MCDEIDYGDLVRVLGKLDPGQLKAVKAFAEYILRDDQVKREEIQL